MRGAEFAELTAFVAVATERNFRRAAVQVGLSPSALSRTIRSLEARLGTRLLNRTTRSVAPTEAGAALFDRLRPAIAEMNDAVRDTGARQHQPKGLVRVNMPRIAAHLVVLPRLAEFRQAYPDVRLDLTIDDSVTDVVAKGFDAGIRSGTLIHQDMIAVRLTQDLRMAVVGSPKYFEGRSIPRAPPDLRGHSCITYRWYETGALYRWSFDGPGGSTEIAVESVVTANDTSFILAAALDGVGLAFLPESFVSAEIADGTLVRVLQDWCQAFSGFHLYYPDRRHVPVALRAFINCFRAGEKVEGPRDQPVFNANIDADVG